MCWVTRTTTCSASSRWVSSKPQAARMSDRHLAHWPPQVPRHLAVPATHLYDNVERAAKQHPDKPYFIFYDTPLSFGQFHVETERLAGYLQQACGVGKGD